MVDSYALGLTWSAAGLQLLASLVGPSDSVPRHSECNSNSNNYANNGGGSSTMKKKYASKFNKVSSSSSGSFSINGNGYHTYIGNPNSNFTHDPFSNSSNILLCKTNDNSIKTSVKNTKGLLQTRIVNNELKANSVNSFKCYLTVNKELKEKYKCKIVGFKDDSSRIPGIDIQIKDKEIFNFEDEEIQLNFSPGHTSGHVFYYFKKNKLAFVGDVVGTGSSRKSATNSILWHFG